jgi:4-amino-4-deoxy-L-arabinose transferase-like glycosyltransferase
VRRRAAAIGAGALLVRLAAIAATPGYRPQHDDASYVRVARTLLLLGRYPAHHVPGGGMQVSAYRPPGWPAALWAVFRTVGTDVVAARMLAALLGAAAVVLMALLAEQLFGARAGVATGLVGALSPLALAVDASLESEALFMALVAGSACLALAARRSGRVAPLVGAGVLAGLCALTRTDGLLVVPAVALLAMPPRHKLPRAAVVVVAALLVVAPWTVRNAEAFHELIPVSTETGNTLAGTYNPVSMRHGEQWLDPRRIGAYGSIYRRYGASAAGDGALTRAVAGWVERHPATVPRVAVADGARLLGLAGGPGWAAFSLRTMSLGGGAGGVVWAGVLAVTLLALAGAWRTRGKGVPGALWLLLAALLVPGALVNGELRLGAPSQVVLIPLAGLALASFQVHFSAQWQLWSRR